MTCCSPGCGWLTAAHDPRLSRSQCSHLLAVCSDLLSESDMYAVLDTAERSLHPDRGVLLLSGITWGYRRSLRTFLMTLVWELLYRFARKTVGGCRPQRLVPYLESRGWRVLKGAKEP